jgi:CdiI immunity protein
MNIPPDIEFPHLAVFVGGYLNQDWVDVYDDPWDAIGDFVQKDADSVPGLIRELDIVLDGTRTEVDLQRLLDDLNMAYALEVDGWTCQTFLRELRHRVRPG